MGKKKKNGDKRGGNRFFRWIRSDLPDEEDKKSPVLLLGVNKISDSPSFVRRRSVDHQGSLRFFRPPKSKYTRGLQGDERLEKIRQDLLVHKNKSEKYIPKSREESIDIQDQCLNLNCAGICERHSSDRGSFSFQRPGGRQSSLCPSEAYHRAGKKDFSETDIEFKYTEHIPENQPSSSKQTSYNITPKSTDRRHFLLTNLNERFRKTLSLDSRKIETNRIPLSLPKDTRPKSLVNTSNIIQNFKPDESFLKQIDKTRQPKKKRKSFFSLDTFFDSKKSDTSSVDDYCSSKYKRFELESDDSPLFRRETQNSKAKTPDLLNLPVIIDSVRKKDSSTRRQLEKLESHYFKTNKTVVDAVPKDATTSNGHMNHVFVDDDDVEYIEPINTNRSTFTSQSTLILEKNAQEKQSILTIFTDDTDIKLPSSVSPKSDVRQGENDLDSIGAYEIEVKEADLLKTSKELTVKVMDKSVDSIGSCSLDVDASTDFSDTTSGSLNLLTPSSTASRVRDFTSRIQERAGQPYQPTPTITPTRTPDDITPTPRKADFHLETEEQKNSTTNSPDLNTKIPDSKTKIPDLNTKNPDSNSKTSDSKLLEFYAEGLTIPDFKGTRHVKQSHYLLRPPTKYSDSGSHRSRKCYKKRDEVSQKKPSYLNIACSINGYSNLTTYDSKLRQDINKSREASPIRPITHTYHYKSENNSLLVPVPVSATKLLVPSLQPNVIKTDLTVKAPPKALTDPSISTPLYVYMAEENKQLKKDFLGPNMTTTGRYVDTFTDEVDKSDISFKSSYSDNNFRKLANGKDSFTSEAYTISSNGVSRVEITKENGEKLTSPMKSFIQQRVERLYGPGALAQGFLMQKRPKKSFSEEEKVLQERSMNCQTDFISPRHSEEYGSLTSDSDVSLPVLRHLRPEFRAQLPIMSPKKTAKADVSPTKDIPTKTDVATSPTKTDVATSALPSQSSSCSSVIGTVSNDSSSNSSDTSQTSTLTNGSALVRTVECSENTLSSVTNSVSVISLSDDSVNGVNVEGERVKDALYFLALEKKETERLLALSATAEKELENLQHQTVSEEILGLLRSAAGKARLLATQKMQQFEGLCYNNINERKDEPFPTTVEDLQGFWDMVCLQVRNVDALYEHLAQLKANGWRETTPPAACSKPSLGPAGAPRRAPPTHEKAKQQAAKREADRKAMLEHRRQMARERQLAARAAGPSQEPTAAAAAAAAGPVEGSQEVEIFVGRGMRPRRAAPRGDCGSLRADSATSP